MHVYVTCTGMRLRLDQLASSKEFPLEYNTATCSKLVELITSVIFVFTAYLRARVELLVKKS